jgi:hypothetical protein
MGSYTGEGRLGIVAVSVLPMIIGVLKARLLIVKVNISSQKKPLESISIGFFFK